MSFLGGEGVTDLWKTESEPDQQGVQVLNVDKKIHYKQGLKWLVAVSGAFRVSNIGASVTPVCFPVRAAQLFVSTWGGSVFTFLVATVESGKTKTHPAPRMTETPKTLQKQTSDLLTGRTPESRGALAEFPRVCV